MIARDTAAAAFLSANQLALLDVKLFAAIEFPLMETPRAQGVPFCTLLLLPFFKLVNVCGLGQNLFLLRSILGLRCVYSTQSTLGRYKLLVPIVNQ